MEKSEVRMKYMSQTLLEEQKNRSIFGEILAVSRISLVTHAKSGSA